VEYVPTLSFEPWSPLSTSKVSQSGTAEIFNDIDYKALYNSVSKSFTSENLKIAGGIVASLL